jgi:hypothetical protein
LLLRPVRIAAALGAAATFALGAATSAAAHDVHTFGKVTVALGWLHEPAYVGFDNAVQVLVKDSAGKPITDISDKDLTVEVSLGDVKMAARALVPTADPDTGLGIPGEYEMHFIPTAPGNYTFHIKGTVTGQTIDETVTASDKTFNTVQDASSVEFPNKVPALSDISTKVDRNTARIADARLAADSSNDRANQALIVGIIALGVGVLLGAGGLATGLAARRRTRA